MPTDRCFPLFFFFLEVGVWNVRKFSIRLQSTLRNIGIEFSYEINHTFQRKVYLFIYLCVYLFEHLFFLVLFNFCL